MIGQKGNINIKNTKDGVSITITSSDQEEVKRIQKGFEIFKLVEELRKSYEK